MASGQTGSGGIGLLGAMFLLFATAKIWGVVDWSWWLVTSPLWVPSLAIAVVIVAGYFYTRHQHRRKAGGR